MISGLLGKQLTILPVGITQQQTLMCAAVGIGVTIVGFIFYIAQEVFSPSGHALFVNDWAFIAYMALFNASCAYLSTTSYGLGSKYLSVAPEKAQNSVLLGNTLTIGIYSGLGLAFLVSSSFGG